MTSLVIWAISICAFVLGYLVVSWAMRLKSPSPKPERSSGDADQSQKDSANSNFEEDAGQSGRGTEAQQPNSHSDSVSKERRYGSLLGLRGSVTKQELRKKYLEAISKYHPDKVNHLAPEFQVMAEERTKALTEAYDYFRSKYGIR